MINATTRAIAHALRLWHEAPSAEVIDLAAERQKREQRAERTPLRPTPPEAA